MEPGLWVEGPDFLARMHRVHPLPELRTQTDDWTGVTTREERKRRQNRLNQRAWRKRQAATRTGPKEPSTAAAPSSSNDCLYGMALRDDARNKDARLTALSDGILLLDNQEDAERLRKLMRQVLQDHSLHAIRPTNLHIIIRLNVLNAIADNATMIGFEKQGLCRDEFISPFCQIGPSHHSNPLTLPGCPVDLQPTLLQRTVPHHPWIDLFPIPTFRDNVLRGIQTGLFEDDDLCYDLLGVQGTDVREQPSLIIWTAAWDSGGWEVNAAFLEKWGTLLRGCPEMLQSTNYWRAKRGQAALNFHTELTVDKTLHTKVASHQDDGCHR